MKKLPIRFGRWAILVAAATAAQAATIRLDELDLSPIQQGWGKPQKNQAVTEKPLRLAGQLFEHGVGTHAVSECWLALDGQALVFTALVGVDDAATNEQASVEFIVSGNDRDLWRSGLCKLGQKPRVCQVDLAGITNLVLLVTDAGDGVNYDHADWAEARFEFTGQPPRVIKPMIADEAAVILTPAAPSSPRINGPKIYAARPGSPFIYRIPVTGERPVQFTAKGLPQGLSLDPDTGIITGRLSQPGRYRTTLLAKNAPGQAQREFLIVAGNTLALTPPMGWNSWYIHYHRVSDKVMREAADQMIASGMADYGYQYVNIDDCWMMKPGANDPEIGGPPRDANGQILSNKRFPDMKAMTDYIHAKGLKAGIYTSPGPRTCGGYEGAFGHEASDAQTFAAWGFDFLKYDWCSYSEKAGGQALPDLKRPYQQMWTHLQQLDRDLVFNLCQYGMGEVWKWGAEVGHCWRTTGDLGLERGSSLPGFYSIGLSNGRHWEYARPGAWNDPDYLLIGWVGDANRMGEGLPTSLSPNEQYAYMSMWCLMAAPLVFSGDMAKLDPFTLNILCNHEVIEVDQDPLGLQARIVKLTSNELVMAKEMEDGSTAVGLFNLGRLPGTRSLAFADLGLSNKQRVRDLWRQRDLGVSQKSFTAEVPRHGVALVRMWRAK